MDVPHNYLVLFTYLLMVLMLLRLCPTFMIRVFGKPLAEPANPPMLDREPIEPLEFQIGTPIHEATGFDDRVVY